MNLFSLLIMWYAIICVNSETIISFLMLITGYNKINIDIQSIEPIHQNMRDSLSKSVPNGH